MAALKDIRYLGNFVRDDRLKKKCKYFEDRNLYVQTRGLKFKELTASNTSGNAMWYLGVTILYLNYLKTYNIPYSEITILDF